MDFKFPNLPKIPKLPNLPPLPKFSGLPKLPAIFKLPNLPPLPKINFEPGKKVFEFLRTHKISVSVIIIVVTFISLSMFLRGYLLSKIETAPQDLGSGFYAKSSISNLPTIAVPSPPTTNSNVLGNSTSKSSNNYVPMQMPTPFPTLPPVPTIAPITIVPVTTTTSNTSATTNTSTNPNCTTGTGVPNAWYSDVYPNPPITTNTGSVTLIVNIRDCNVNLAPVNDKLTITLTSSDSTAKINGSSSPVTIQAQNGQASFSVSSQNSITDTFTVQDTTGNFTITDINNHNPSVAFTNTTSGNSKCTTGSGIPNFWYSDVSPTSPVSANTGATVTFTVNIKDCNQSDVSSDNLKISQTSSDSSLTINGSAPPVSIQAQNGQATFTVTSQNAGTDNLTVQDTTSNFTVTDANNHNPSIVFSGSSSTPTPTPTPTPTQSGPTTTPAPTPSQSSTPTPTSSNTPTPTPTGT